MLAEVGVAPASYLAFRASSDNPVAVGEESIANCLWRTSVRPGRGYAQETDPYWHLDWADPAARSALRNAVLAAGSQACGLTNRRALLSMVRDESTELHELAVRPRSRALALLLADERWSGLELERLLAEIAQQPGGQELVDWVRTRRVFRRFRR